MAVTPNSSAVPPAPPAPSVKPITGSGNQNTTASALGNQQQTQATSQSGMAAQSSPAKTGLGSSSLGRSSQPQAPKAPQPRSAGAGHRQVNTVTPITPQGKYTEKIDPRDSTYWQNRAALEATLGVEQQALIQEQQLADSAFAMESATMDDYNRRRQRNIAEARMGRGLRSGGFRRERAENDLDFMNDMYRRTSEKAMADADRRLRGGRLDAQFVGDLQRLEQESAQRYAEGMLDEAQNSAGDRQNLEPQFRKEDARAALRSVNKTIERLRARRDNAGPKQQERIDARLKRLRARRTKLKGQIN